METRTASLPTTTPSAPQPIRILLATDGSDDARAAAAFLKALPLPPGSTIQVVTVLGGVEWVLPEWFQAQEQEWARKLVDTAAAALARPEVEARGLVRTGARAYEIIQAGEELHADLVVVGSKGLTGIPGFLVGSVARNVVKHARRPVVVARAPEHGLKQVVVGVDESEHAVRAVELAARLPLPEGAAVTAVSVVRPYEPYPGLVPDDALGFQRQVEDVRRRRWEQAAGVLAAAAGPLRAAGRLAGTEVREGDPATEILRLAAEREADLVVAGARGASLIEGLVMGSVADRLLKTATCSLLIVD